MIVRILNGKHLGIKMNEDKKTKTIQVTDEVYSFLKECQQELVD
jgi:hypothetical protein